MRKEPAKDGLEQDWTTGWRKVLCYMVNRSGIGKKAKRQMNKRARKRKDYLEQ